MAETQIIPYGAGVPAERGRSPVRGPVFASLFVEHKNVLGLTVRATAGNLLNARSRWDRTVYAGRRNVAPIDFVETRNRLIGPIFSFSVRGEF
jgi:hypothetical protein